MSVRRHRPTCNKILPTVYDDSLSFYSVVNKCILKINELIDKAVTSINGKTPVNGNVNLTTDDINNESEIAENKLTDALNNIHNVIETVITSLIGKQDTLVSGENIKTVNNYSLLGSGNIEIQSGGTSDYDELSNRPKLNGVVITGNHNESYYGIDVPTKTSDLDNDSGFIDETSLADYVPKTTKINDVALNTDVELTADDIPCDDDDSVQTHIEQIESDITDLEGDKQDVLVSGTNIKTVNNYSLLGSGNITIGGSGGTTVYDELEGRPQLNGVVISGNHDESYYGIDVPIKTSDLENDSGFIDESGLDNYVPTSRTINGNALSGNVTLDADDIDCTDESSVQDHIDQIEQDVEDVMGGVVALEAVKQDTLVSGTNIKTINGTSILGSGNISISEPTDYVPNTRKVNNKALSSDIELTGYDIDIDENTIAYHVNQLYTGKQAKLTSGSNIKSVNGNSLLGSGNLSIPMPTKTSDLTNDSGFAVKQIIRFTVTTSAIWTKAGEVYYSDTTLSQLSGSPMIIADYDTEGSSSWADKVTGIKEWAKTVTIQAGSGNARIIVTSPFTVAVPIILFVFN